MWRSVLRCYLTFLRIWVASGIFWEGCPDPSSIPQLTHCQSPLLFSLEQGELPPAQCFLTLPVSWGADSVAGENVGFLSLLY